MTGVTARQLGRLAMRPARRLLWVALLLGASACGWVELGDTLTTDLPPAEAAACRQAVADELARQGVDAHRVRRIYYQRLQIRRRGAPGRAPGYNAWVYPKQGREVMIIELSGSCQVRSVRRQGPERGAASAPGGL